MNRVKLISAGLFYFAGVLVFGTSHVFATYDFPGGRWVFGLVVFGLGLLGAQAMFKEDGLVGPVLFHAGYDLMIMIPILNSL